MIDGSPPWAVLIEELGRYPDNRIGYLAYGKIALHEGRFRTRLRHQEDGGRRFRRTFSDNRLGLPARCSGTLP